MANARKIIFRARQFEFNFPRLALVMGVVNVTPDSFYDGGKFFTTDAAVRHALELAAQGAKILDIGGESTRPGAEPVEEKEELRRVIPVIEKLATKTKVPLSIDTMKPAVARAALKAGASIVNDVAAARRGGGSVPNPAASRPGEPTGAHRLKAGHPTDPMWQLVSEFHAGYVCMHAQGTPRTMQQHPHYQDVVREVSEFFCERLDALATAGVAPEQIVLDPGMGFGKTPAHNLALLARLSRFTTLGRPLLVGVSRKSFLGTVTGAGANERLPASLACAILAVESGARIIRAHDVLETTRAVRMAEAVLAKQRP